MNNCCGVNQMRLSSSHQSSHAITLQSLDPMSKALTVAFLLPEDAPAALLAALPKSGVDLNVVKIPGDELVPADIKAATWIPGCPAARLQEFLDAHPGIAWLHCLSAGVDYVSDIIKTRLVESEVQVSNGRGAFSSSLGEYAIAAMLHFNKQVPRCIQNRKARTWDKFVMDELKGKTLGFVGFGHIAKTTATMAAPFGLRMIALRRHPDKSAKRDDPEQRAAKRPRGEEPFTLAATYGLDASKAFYAQCDYVVCSLPLTAETRGSVDAKSFAAMKPSCVFISLGRGAAIDESALYNALATGQIAGAACDVFAKEPLPGDSPLWQCENLLMTAHNADNTADYLELAFSTWAENFECFRRGQPLATPIDKSAGY